ncbi:MAG: Ni/Fe-hydrogenase subunit HybB-like protein [Paracoccaceae bacterium]|jgi:Ni/Fe-hydrogenase subunit HybB-like protein
MERTIYREIRATKPVWGAAITLVAFIAAALGSFFYVEHYGHIVTGMNNQVVWGLPHVFAIFLIVAASGALNVASIVSVFDQTDYKPLARLSALLAMALLVGGLAVLVLDLGRPDRIIVAMTTYNFRSIFAWNIFLYTGFLGVVALYLFAQMTIGIPYSRVRKAGTLAFVWRLALTTGTGSIFGWLVARPGYDAAIMAPMFIAMSFSFGLAMFILVVTTLCRLGHRPFGDLLMLRLGRLLAIFVAAVLYFTAVRHLTNLYAAEHRAFEIFTLTAGGTITTLFWVGQVFIGGLAPLMVLFHPTFGKSPKAPVVASVLVVMGAFAQLYVIVIGGQAFPMPVFPGYEVSSSFFDGTVASYSPRLPEVLLGLGGLAIALFVTGLGAKILRILPTNLSDANVGLNR